MNDIQAREWLERAEETYAAADAELTEAKRGKDKKEAKEVLAWAKEQIEKASEAVLLCQINLSEVIDDSGVEAQMPKLSEDNEEVLTQV
jgi:vacuolar-type H+-ATPase subunit H